MPPSSTGPLALSQYLTKLIAAMCLERGGELRIRRSKIREVDEEGAPQMLVEDSDTETDELVLRFGSKHSAVYPVTPECRTQRPNSETISPPTLNPSSPQSRPPLTEDQLAALEMVNKLRKVKAQQSRVRDTRQSDLSEILGQNSTS